MDMPIIEFIGYTVATICIVVAVVLALGSVLKGDNVEKIKFENGYCSAACRTWFCCQDCDIKAYCSNHCKYAMKKSKCKFFREEESHE